MDIVLSCDVFKSIYLINTRRTLVILVVRGSNISGYLDLYK